MLSFRSLKLNLTPQFENSLKVSRIKFRRYISIFEIHWKNSNCLKLTRLELFDLAAISVIIRQPIVCILFQISSRYVEYFMRYEGKAKKPRSPTDVLVFSSFLIHYWIYQAEIWKLVLPTCALMNPWIPA
jgi:hypothetical protein